MIEALFFAPPVFVLVVSLLPRPPRSHFLVCAWCLTLMSVGLSALLIGGDLLVNYNDPSANVPLLLISLLYCGTSLSLFPFAPAGAGPKILCPLVGLTAVWGLFHAPGHAIAAGVYLLLWWRVYALRRATDHLARPHRFRGYRYHHGQGHRRDGSQSSAAEEQCPAPVYERRPDPY